MTTPRYVQQSDSVPQFWQFLKGLRPDDLIVELIQNDLDANAEHTSISFDSDRLTCQGDGDFVEETGWERLSYYIGAGDQVESKHFRIGVKNHGLKACFSIGDDIILRSHGLKTVQTLYKDGTDNHPSPGALPLPEADIRAPSVGCSVEVPYRTKKLKVAKGEPFELDPTNELFADQLFWDACCKLPFTLMGVVFPAVRQQYTLTLNHHKFGRVEFKWRAKKAKRVDGKGRRGFILFGRECEVSSGIPTVISETLYEQACAFRGSIPRGINVEIPEFFQPHKKAFRMEVAWTTDTHGRPTSVKGVRRYPIGYSGTADSALSCLGVHFSGPYRSDAERHGVSEQDPLNTYIDEACREALVDIMACYLLPRHSARAMELYVSRDRPNDESTLDMLRRAIEKKVIPLQNTLRWARPRRIPSTSNNKPKLRNRTFLGPRRNSAGGIKLILIPTFTWDSGRLSPLLSELRPESEDQIDKSVPPTVLRYLEKNKFSDSVITFDENDVIDRMQSKKEDCIFPWKDGSEWKTSFSNAETAKKYLDVAYLAIQNGKLEAERQVIDNVYLPDSNSQVRPHSELYSGALLPAGLEDKHIGPILHRSLRNHRLLRRNLWKPKPFTMDDYLDHADMETAPVEQQKLFWRWLKGNWKGLKPKILHKIALLPVWPDSSGNPRRLDDLCEPADRRIASIIGNALKRPSLEIHRSRMVKRNGRGKLTLRSVPRVEEIEAFLSDRLSKFPRDRVLSHAERTDFHQLEVDLDLLTTVRQLKGVLAGLSEEYAIALNCEGFLKNPAELVKYHRPILDLHLPARHVIDRSESVLQRVMGWAARSGPRSSQIEDALREDSSRIDVHIQRLQEYVKQSKNEGTAPDGIRNLPCIPVEGTLLPPILLALRGQRDFWGSWKTRIPLAGISAEVQRIYREVGVVGGDPDIMSSRQFFEWLYLQPMEIITNHTDQILRHIQHKAGPRSWESIYPALPFIPVEGHDGRIRLVTKSEATKRRTRIVIPDFEPLQDRIRASQGAQPAELAIVEGQKVREPITADLIELGLQSLKELAREPVSVIGEGNAGEPPGLYFMQALDALKSGVKGLTLPKRLDRLDVNKKQHKLRSNWRERLSTIKSVKTAETITARYRVSRRELSIETPGRLDQESEILWLRSSADMEESFFHVIADLIFDQPQQYLGFVLQRAYKMDLTERNPRLIPEVDGLHDELDFDESGDTAELTSSTGSHPIPSPDSSRNSPTPGPIPSFSGRLKHSGSSTRTTSNRSQPPDELAQIADLKENQYAWHCQVCLSESDPKILAPTSSYAFRHQNRRQIMEAHHCDQVRAGGARHAGNLLLLCDYHHQFLGDAVSRREVVHSLQSTDDHTVTFQSDDGDIQAVEGKLVMIHPPQRDDPIRLFFTVEHLKYWKTKASEEGIIQVPARV